LEATTGLLTVANGSPVTANVSGTGTVGLTGVGVTVSDTVTGPGGITVAAGTGTLTNTVTTGTISNNSTANAINLTGDDMVLAGAITAGTSAINIDSATAGRSIVLGTGGSGLGLASAELTTITGSGR